MKKGKAIKEQSASSKVTPYELATLASRIYSERCGDPKEAIATAEKLLGEARYAIARKEAEERKHEEEWAEYDKWLETRVDWVRGIKKITKERRRDRATRRFAEFMEYEASGEELSHHKRDGFTMFEVMLFEHEFGNWRKQPKRKNGRQGRRIRKDDGRLRTELVGLVPMKPQKRH